MTRYEFHKVFRTLYEFCNVDISATYAKAIKDRLYCELPGSVKRRASADGLFSGGWCALIELLRRQCWCLRRRRRGGRGAAVAGVRGLEGSVHLRQVWWGRRRP